MAVTKPKHKKKIISLWMDEKTLKMIDYLIQRGKFKTRSEFINTAVNKLLDEYIDQIADILAVLAGQEEEDEIDKHLLKGR